MTGARTLFFGSGPFAVAVLEALVTIPELSPGGAGRAPPPPAGGGGLPAPTPVAARAAPLAVPVLVPERLRDPAVTAALAALAAEIGILADYGKILPPAVLGLPPHGILNLHPSLLPRHRGAAPIAAAILAGDAESGVSLFRMDAGMDTGPLVAVERVRLAGDEDAPALEARLAVVAGALLQRTVGPYLRGDLSPVPQAEEGVTVTRPLAREDGRLDSTIPAAVLERRVRAFRPWPGSFVDLRDGRLLVLRAAAVASRPGDVAGALVEEGAGLALATTAGRLVLLEVQPAGGRPMDGPSYRRGRPGVVGARVG